MPVHTGKDTQGCFAQWGKAGKKYRYTCNDDPDMKKAKQKAFLQGFAATGGTMTEDWTEQQWKEHDKCFEMTEAEKPQDKPGGSNVGKYKGVKNFCGPSGGAPAGSFPVNTKKRAIAALAYANNAPNPSGIKTCVCRHWPTLDACKPPKKKVDHIYMGLSDHKH